MNKYLICQMLNLQTKRKFWFSKIFHLEFVLRYSIFFESSSRVSIIFKSLTYTIIIVGIYVLKLIDCEYNSLTVINKVLLL